MKDYKKNFGRKIKYLRDINDVTQMDLARYLGYKSSGAVAQIEAGTKGVKFENIQKIADFFGIDAVFLINDTEFTKADLQMAVQLRALCKQGAKAKHYEAIKALLAASQQDK